MFKPGNLIILQPAIPFFLGLNLIQVGTKIPEVSWFARNTIGLFVKTSPDDKNTAICLFGDKLFGAPFKDIQLV